MIPVPFLVQITWGYDLLPIKNRLRKSLLFTTEHFTVHKFLFWRQTVQKGTECDSKVLAGVDLTLSYRVDHLLI